MLSTQDIETLEIFAYNRLLVRRFAEALSVYNLLTHVEREVQKSKWRLGQVWCLYHLGLMKQAREQLSTLNSRGRSGGRHGSGSGAALSGQENALFSRLKRLLPPPPPPTLNEENL